MRSLEAELDAEKEAHRETSFSLISARHQISSLQKSQSSQAEELGRVHQQLAGYKVALGVRDNEIAAEQNRLQTVRRVRDMAMQRTKAMAAQHANQTSGLEQRLKDGESDRTQLVSTIEELNRKLEGMSATALGERLDHAKEKTRLEDRLSAERNAKEDYVQTIRELQTTRKEEQLLASKRQRILLWELGSMRNFMQLSGRKPTLQCTHDNTRHVSPYLLVQLVVRG